MGPQKARRGLTCVAAAAGLQVYRVEEVVPRAARAVALVRALRVQVAPVVARCGGHALERRDAAGQVAAAGARARALALQRAVMSAVRQSGGWPRRRAGNLRTTREYRAVSVRARLSVCTLEATPGGCNTLHWLVLSSAQRTCKPRGRPILPDTHRGHFSPARHPRAHAAARLRCCCRP